MKPHEHAEACRRDVGQLGAVDHELDAAVGDLLLQRLFELRRGMGVEKAVDADHRDIILE